MAARRRTRELNAPPGRMRPLDEAPEPPAAPIPAVPVPQLDLMASTLALEARQRRWFQERDRAAALRRPRVPAETPAAAQAVG